VEELRNLVVLVAAVLVLLPGLYFRLKNRLLAFLETRLDKISGGQISTLEDLVEVALVEKRSRVDTPIAVYGPESLWAELRKGGFAGATVVPSEGAPRPERRADVAVVDAATLPEERISRLGEHYVLIYKDDKQRYKGALPPGAEVTYANSHITLDGPLMETLRFMNARSAAAIQEP
jgi:hypothetical protein